MLHTTPTTPAALARRPDPPGPLAVAFRAKLAGQPAPAGEATARVLGGYRRTAADRGRGQAAPLRADGLAAILATAARPRTDGRGVESHTTAHRRGRLDAVIASLLFMGGLRSTARGCPSLGKVSGPPRNTVAAAGVAGGSSTLASISPA